MLFDCSHGRTGRSGIFDMNKKGFGTLANLAKILEDASDPESQVREDKREPKSKSIQKPPPRKKKVMDPKRKAWHDRRLQEQAAVAQPAVPIVPAATATQAATRKTAVDVSSGLLNTLATVKEAKPKDGSKRPETWKRKPGDPIF
jgi:hypothetical protein